MAKFNFRSFFVFIMLFFIPSINAEDNNLDAYSKGMSLMIDGKYKEAFKVFNEAYKKGDKKLCAYELGECYFEGLGCTQNYTMAFNLHLEAAQNNNPYAAYSVAMDYYNGLGCKKNDIEALKWNKIAAESGMIPQAANNYASMLLKGEGCKKDIKLAFRWFLKAAEGGDYMAQYTVAMCYYHGNYMGEDIGISRNLNKAKYYFTESAKQGHPMAAVRLDQWFK